MKSGDLWGKVEEKGSGGLDYVYGGVSTFTG